MRKRPIRAAAVSLVSEPVNEQMGLGTPRQYRIPPPLSAPRAGAATPYDNRGSDGATVHQLLSFTRGNLVPREQLPELAIPLYRQRWRSSVFSPVRRAHSNHYAFPCRRSASPPAAIEGFRNARPTVSHQLNHYRPPPLTPTIRPTDNLTGDTFRRLRPLCRRMTAHHTIESSLGVATVHPCTRKC